MHAGLRAHGLVRLELEAFEPAVQRDHGAAHAAVAHEQVAAQPDPQQWLARRHGLHEVDQVGAVGRLEVAVGRAADAPARVRGQRLALQQAAARRHAFLRAGFASSAGAMSATPLTNTGDTAPRSRTPRARARPS